MKGNRELPSAWFSSVRPRCKGRKLAGGPKGEGGRCGERAVCEELGETKWTDADSDDMASMSPQGLIHGTACGSGEGTPKKLSEPAISRRANVCKSRRVVRTDSNSFGCRGPNAFQKAPPPRFAGVQTSPKPRTYQARDFWSPGSHGRNRCLFLSLVTN